MLNQENIDFLKSRFESISVESGKVNKYSDIGEEYDLLVHGAAMRVFPASVITLTGKDVVDFVHRISTNDIKSVKSNSKISTLFTNEKGRVIDRTVYIKLPDKSILLGHESERVRLARWIEKYIIMEDIKLSDDSEHFNLFEVSGPQADSYLTMICGKCIDVLNYENVIDILIENNSVRILRIREVDGTDKFWLLTKAENFNSILENFIEQKSVFDFGMVGEHAYNLYRIEKGIPVVPKELNDDFNPHEANVIDDVSFTKGCYIGQEVIARLDTYDKVQRRLKNIIINESLDFNGDRIGLYNDKNEEIGLVTSLAKSLKDDRIIGLGYVRKKYDQDSSATVKLNDNKLKVQLKDIGIK